MVGPRYRRVPRSPAVSVIGLAATDRPRWAIIARTPATVTRRTWPRGATFALAAVCGGLVASSLPPFGWWPLGVAGIGGFALLLSGPIRPAAGAAAPSARARAAIGAGVGLGQFAIGLWWATEFHVAGYLGLIVQGTATTALAGALVPARVRWGVLGGLPAALVVGEWIRNHFPAGGIPIGGTALGQADGPLAPTVRLGGSLLLVGVVALAGAGLAEIVRACFAAATRSAAPSEPDKARLAPGIVAVALVAVVVTAGRFGPDGAGRGPHLALRVVAVQGGGQRGLRAVETDPDLVTQRQLDASALLRAPLDLVLWPEDVVHVASPVGDTPEGAHIGSLAARLHTTVVAGVVTDVADRFRNSAVAWSPQGTIVASYDKVHRVPFGEYVPARGLIEHLVKLNLVPADAIAGHGPGILVTPAGPMGVAISYEVFYDERARAAVQAGGEVLLVPTNAASYRNTQVPSQEVAATRLRALETGRDAVQASPTGYSALVGPDGRVRSRTVLGRQQLVVGTVQRRTGRTIFVRFGDLPVLLLAMLGLIAAAGVGFVRSRSVRPETTDREPMTRDQDGDMARSTIA
jgi:apolipoprotein N-acyltransferase